MAEYVCELTDDYPDVPFGSDDYSGTVERRERIVRCRDCRYAEPMPLSFSDLLICAYLDDMSVEPEGFCAWGEKRNGN
ncbi:hypothetical protein [Collinsella intestinalis]|uniref:hypothetical protein n=1 Tax=Collinsella intestinalis TaxID=147207 RepID=UPI0025A3C3B6|nr:hypothetical protein [Collinsella intestinalis]MDM8162434.1 hypothetical protein [Collinsella intestinalis]